MAVSETEQAFMDAVSAIIKGGSVAPDRRPMISGNAWDVLVSYYEERMSKSGAAEFMAAHFIRVAPLRDARRL